jgi:hypothetical protein
MSHHPSHEHEHGHEHHHPKKHWAKRFWWAIGVFVLIFAFMAFYLVNVMMY